MCGATDASVNVQIPVTGSSHTLYAVGFQPMLGSMDMTLDISPRVPAHEYTASLRATIKVLSAAAHAVMTSICFFFDMYACTIANQADMVS